MNYYTEKEAKRQQLKELFYEQFGKILKGVNLFGIWFEDTGNIERVDIIYTDINGYQRMMIYKINAERNGFEMISDNILYSLPL